MLTARELKRITRASMVITSDYFTSVNFLPIETAVKCFYEFISFDHARGQDQQATWIYQRQFPTIFTCTVCIIVNERHPRSGVLCSRILNEMYTELEVSRSHETTLDKATLTCRSADRKVISDSQQNEALWRVTLPWYITISIFSVTIADPLRTRKPVPLEVRCKAFKSFYEILRESITTGDYLVLSFFKKMDYVFYIKLVTHYFYYYKIFYVICTHTYMRARARL